MSLPERLKQQNKVYDIRKIGKIINVVDNTKHKIKIFCPKYLKNLGNVTKNELENILKINCELCDFTELHSIKKQHINEYFFIIGFSCQNLKISHSFKYFLYQLEQVNNEEKYETVFTKENKELIFYSIITFDYSKLNIKNYPEELKNKVTFLPPLINIKKINKIEKKYDVLFFGANTQRRQNIIKNLNNFFSVKYVTNVYGKELENLIYESKICLNLHYYKESVLETVRLHELLSHHSVIISELPYKDDLLYSKQYQKLLCFVDIIKDDMSNINILISKIDEILKNYSNYNNKYKLKIVEKFSEDIKKEYLLFNDYLKFFKYKNLFHKYFVGREVINTNIKYKVLKNNITNDFKENLLYAHLHCYNIEEFYTIYGDYLELIEHFFKIIITYSIGNVASSLINRNYSILKIKNKGLDIGGKFCCVHYLNSLNINYDYIFFLHSKSDITKRIQYFKPFFKYLYIKKIKNQDLYEIYNYDGLFPNIKWTIIDNVMKNDEGIVWPERNNLYKNELLDYLNCETINNDFFEGNVYILSQEVINKIFTDLHIYNMLNNGKMEDFDYNWILKNSIINNNLNATIHEAYNFFKSTKYKEKVNTITKFDGCIEHCFERSILSLCNNYKQLDYFNTCCILFYVNDIEIFEKIMKKYTNFFNNKNYLKYTHILFFTNTIKIANKLEEIPIVSKTITCSPNLNNNLNVFSFALSQVKNSNIQYDIYLTITTNKFEGMQFYYNKLDLIFNNLENIFYKPIHSQVFL